MRDLIILFIHLAVTVARLFGPGGARSVVAESLLVKHQLVILNRSRTRAPTLRPSDRILAGLCGILIRPTRLVRSAIVLKPSTILTFHRALVSRKYHLLFTCGSRKLIAPGIKPLFVRNGDVNHRALGIEQCVPIPAAALVENLDYPS
jgi:putative transposase